MTKEDSSVHETDEATLVQQAAAGNADAVATLYDQHQQDIFRYIVSRVQNQHTAEDLTAEVFTRMVANIASYTQTDIPFRAWLYRIARNLIVDHYRQSKKRNTVELDAASHLTQASSNPGDQVAQQLTVERVQQALTTIDPIQREVVVLRFIVGLSLHEVAITLDKSIAAIKSQQHRGLNALRAALQAM